MTMRINSWTSFTASIISAETGDNENNTLYRCCAIATKLSQFDSFCQLFGETEFYFKQISYIIRRVYNKTSLQFLHDIFNLFWSSLCTYTLWDIAFLLHSNVCASALRQTVAEKKKVHFPPVDHPSCSKQHAVLQYRLVEHQKEDGTLGRKVK